MSKISVIGSGSWGTAIANTLAENGHKIILWSFLKEEYEMLEHFHEHKSFLPGVILHSGISYTDNIEKAVTGSEIIVLATPSFAVAQTAAKIKPFYDNQIIVCISKGFEDSTLSCLSDVIKRETGSSKICMLSGPSHAEEVAKKMPTTLVAASDNEEISGKVQDDFMCSYLRIYTSDDMLGVQLGGALKNIISLCAGIADGMGYGDNLKAALMTRGMAEIIRLGTKMGGKPETFYGLSGMGDLIVTCTSMHSRNRRAGILIGQGRSPEEAKKEVGMVVEGIIACESAYKLSLKYGVDMPIVKEAYGILYEGNDPKEAINRLMIRAKKSEW